MSPLYKQEAYHTCSPKGSRQIISGWYSVYPAPVGVACLFRFDWKSGFAKIWWPDESTSLYWSKTSYPRKSLNEGQLLRAIVVTITSFWYIPKSQKGTIPMADLVIIIQICWMGFIYIYIYIFFLFATRWSLNYSGKCMFSYEYFQ